MSSFDPSDFRDFSDGSEQAPPEELAQVVAGGIRRELNPSWTLLVCKMIGIQAFVGLVSMVFCPQFELSWTHNDEVYHFFHRLLGEHGCMAVCGAIFMGSGAVVAATYLSLAELRLLVQSRFLLCLALSGMAMGGFLLAGVQTYLSLALVWILGGTAASILALISAYSMQGPALSADA